MKLKGERGRQKEKERDRERDRQGAGIGRKVGEDGQERVATEKVVEKWERERV